MLGSKLFLKQLEPTPEPSELLRRRFPERRRFLIIMMRRRPCLSLAPRPCLALRSLLRGLLSRESRCMPLGAAAAHLAIHTRARLCC